MRGNILVSLLVVILSVQIVTPYTCDCVQDMCTNIVCFFVLISCKYERLTKDMRISNSKKIEKYSPQIMNIIWLHFVTPLLHVVTPKIAMRKLSILSSKNGVNSLNEHKKGHIVRIINVLDVVRSFHVVVIRMEIALIWKFYLFYIKTLLFVNITNLL